MRTSFKVLISDLDGILLDDGTHSPNSSIPALRELRERKIPLVLCTSKTFEEMVVFQKNLGISDPFIVENGGAIYFRKGYFAATDSPCETKGDYQRIGLGLPYNQLIPYMALIKKLVPTLIISFSDMSAKELAEDSGLSVEAANRAQHREYDEPFKIVKNTKAALERIDRTIKGSGLTVTWGGNYFHLAGGSDTGRAVALVRKLYQECYGSVSLAGVGYDTSDLPMLENVHHPMIVANTNGRHHLRLAQRLPQARQAHGVGPEGWNEVVSGMLKEWDRLHER